LNFCNNFHYILPHIQRKRLRNKELCENAFEKWRSSTKTLIVDFRSSHPYLSNELGSSPSCLLKMGWVLRFFSKGPKSPHVVFFVYVCYRFIPSDYDLHPVLPLGNPVPGTGLYRLLPRYGRI